MTRKYTNDRGIGNFLRNRVEEGRSIGVVTEQGEFYEGTIIGIEQRDGAPLDDDGDTTAVHIEGTPDGTTIYVAVGQWQTDYSEDWETWIKHEKPFETDDDGTGEKVKHLYDWDEMTEMVDEYLDDLDDDSQAKIHMEINDILDELDGMLNDIEFTKERVKDVMEGEITLAEYEQALYRREAENGGQLKIDRII